MSGFTTWEEPGFNHMKKAGTLIVNQQEGMLDCLYLYFEREDSFSWASDLCICEEGFVKQFGSK
jgi:hypothetical protein